CGNVLEHQTAFQSPHDHPAAKRQRASLTVSIVVSETLRSELGAHSTCGEGRRDTQRTASSIIEPDPDPALRRRERSGPAHFYVQHHRGCKHISEERHCLEQQEWVCE